MMHWSPSRDQDPQFLSRPSHSREPEEVVGGVSELRLSPSPGVACGSGWSPGGTCVPLPEASARVTEACPVLIAVGDGRGRGEASAP